MGFLNQNRFVLLFCSLLFFLIATPIVQELRDHLHSQLPDIVEVCAVSLLLMAAVLSMNSNQRWNLYGLGLGVPAIVLGLLPRVAVSQTIEEIRTVLEIAFLVCVMLALLRYVFLTRRVTTNTLFAALSVYLLLGVLWAVVLLTTLGYGDIVPATPTAQTLAMLEAIIGQLYLTVLIARLVGLHISESMQMQTGER